MFVTITDDDGCVVERCRVKSERLKDLEQALENIAETDNDGYIIWEWI